MTSVPFALLLIRSRATSGKERPARQEQRNEALLGGVELFSEGMAPASHACCAVIILEGATNAGKKLGCDNFGN